MKTDGVQHKHAPHPVALIGIGAAAFLLSFLVIRLLSGGEIVWDKPLTGAIGIVLPLLIIFVMAPASILLLVGFLQLFARAKTAGAKPAATATAAAVPPIPLSITPKQKKQLRLMIGLGGLLLLFCVGIIVFVAVDSNNHMLQELQTLVQSESTEARAQAVSALSGYGGDDVLAMLTGALQDEDAGVRRAAAVALGTRGDDRAVEALAAAMNDGSADVRFSAMAALGRIGGESAVQPLIAALDGDPVTRQVAVFALAQAEDVSAGQALADALGSGRERKRGRAG